MRSAIRGMAALGVAEIRDLHHRLAEVIGLSNRGLNLLAAAFRSNRRRLTLTALDVF